MAKQKRKLTRAEKAAKARRNAEFKIIFVNGKQKRVRRRDEIEGIPIDDFIRANADPIWLHQNEMWEYLEPEPLDEQCDQPAPADDDVPF
jgi:16S rRNA U516 pseudouridylate synthase RsuA-like enzyme